MNKPRSRREGRGGAQPRTAKTGAPARFAAERILARVLDQHQSLDAALEEDFAAGKPLPPRDRALARAIVGMTLRHLGEIEACLDRLVERRPKDAGSLIRTLQIAAAQILFMEIADHAAVSLAVERIGSHARTRRYKGLANAVLRRMTREKDALIDPNRAARVNTPDWLWNRWARAYGDITARRIAEAHMIEPSLDLSARGQPDEVAEETGGATLATGTVRLIPEGPVDAMRGFAEGRWWVQDAAAALPPRLLGDVRGQRVADLCSAPGGKTLSLAAAGAHVTSVDISAARLKRVRDNLERTGLTADIVAADLLAWQPSEPFDAILLDAPCSSTGTIRRHPDVARLKKPADIAALADLQTRLIDRAAGMLKPGGRLVYCTCSLEPEEGEYQLIDAAKRDDLTHDPITADEVGGLAELVTEDGSLRTLPCHLAHDEARLAGLDGFFAARLIKA